MLLTGDQRFMVTLLINDLINYSPYINNDKKIIDLAQRRRRYEADTFMLIALKQIKEKHSLPSTREKDSYAIDDTVNSVEKVMRDKLEALDVPDEVMEQLIKKKVKHFKSCRPANIIFLKGA